MRVDNYINDKFMSILSKDCVGLAGIVNFAHCNPGGMSR